MPNLSLSLMKHAQPFLRSLSVANIDDYEIWSQEWSNLNKVKREANRTYQQLIEKCEDGISERNARELEAAGERILEFVDAVDCELDRRQASGTKSVICDPSTPDTSKVPTSEGRSAAMMDNAIFPYGDDEKFALEPEERMRCWATVRTEDHFRGLTPGAYLRAMVTGAKNDVEARALAEGTDSSGGYTVPTVLASQIIDALRAESVAIRAGAQTVPITSDNHTIAKVTADPTPAFRNEAASVTESDPTFGAVTFTPRSMMMLTKVSRELLEDSINISTALPNIITSAMAAEMDRICLEGTGSAPQPRGIKNQSGIGTTAHNAALTSYAPLLVAQTDILTNNAGPVNAIIMHPRDAGDLAALSDTTNQPLNMPPALSGVPMLTTTSIAADGGSGSNESTIYVGNFRNLMIGMRNDIRIEIARERFADNHQYGFYAHMRFDVAVAHAKSFHTITGVKS